MPSSQEKIKKHNDDLLKYSSIIVTPRHARQEDKIQYQNEFNSMDIIIPSSKFHNMSEEYDNTMNNDDSTISTYDETISDDDENDDNSSIISDLSICSSNEPMASIAYCTNNVEKKVIADDYLARREREYDDYRTFLTLLQTNF